GIPVDRATWRQIRDSAAAVGFDEAELDAWTQRCCVGA
ncbi:malate/lactate/ureidoglycolate dehydrogenase, partial [Burkholderia multivorans]